MNNKTGLSKFQNVEIVAIPGHANLAFALLHMSMS